MQITDELIERFLASQCTGEEAAEVAAYLGKAPSALEKHLRTNWNEAQGTGELPDGCTDDMWQAICEKTRTKKQAGKWRRMNWLRIAACLVLLMSAWWILRPGKVPANGEATAIVQNEKKTTDREIVRENKTGKDIKVQLPDHSVVTLSNDAVIKYAASFAVDNRDVKLEGVAFFEVAKDSTKPFTVYSGRFATTALGTSFSVAENEDGCTIKLYTGKVVVKTTVVSVVGWNKNVFLSPHQQMHYDAVKHSVAVAAFGNDGKDLFVKKKVVENKDKTDNALVFDNTPLAEVMNKLMRRYKVSIKYNRTETDGMYFSGTILKDDSLRVILNVIARMNRLTIAQTGDGFLVSKPQ